MMTDLEHRANEEARHGNREALEEMTVRLAEAEARDESSRMVLATVLAERDEARARVAAVVEEAAGICDHFAKMDYAAMHYPKEAGMVASVTACEIRQSIHALASAPDFDALDAVKERVRAEEERKESEVLEENPCMVLTKVLEELDEARARMEAAYKEAEALLSQIFENVVDQKDQGRG